MKITILNKSLELKLGDITEEKTDAIVNAANSGLSGGGGVDGAIHRAAGPELMVECKKIGYCPTGSTVATGSGKLRCRYVFHAVGPIWKGGSHDEELLLASAYRRSMELAEEHSCKSISFPSISTGVYRFPLDRAAPIALNVVRKELVEGSKVSHVSFILFDEITFAAYENALRELT